jgi:hypothetical protein
MRTPKGLYSMKPTVYTCELETCPRCGGPLVAWHYVSGPKTVQTLTAVVTIGQRPKHCADPTCPGHAMAWKSAAWLQIAPQYCTYGYDVIAQIGWQRQTRRERFGEIHQLLRASVPICEAQVRYLYHYQYLPLLACHERQHREALQALADERGLILSLDGLAPEGGEPQLWVVRELQTGLTLRSGWLSLQDQATFADFLQPIADQGWRVVAVMSDKQRGLEPAVPQVFPTARHAFCQTHYFKNAAAAVAAADETMKVTLRQGVRAAVGDLIRGEGGTAQPGVLTVTGLVPSPLAATPTPRTTPSQTEPDRPPPAQEERQAIVQDLLRRVRYVLTLKARPPFRLAGLEMVVRLTEVLTCLETLIQHHTDARLVQLRQGLHSALQAVHQDYDDLRQAAAWLDQIAALLDPAKQPERTGDAVRTALFTYLEELDQQTQDTPRLRAFYTKIRDVSHSYAKGLFHSYDLPALPRTNNDRESEFRDLNRRLLSTTGQKGLVRRLIQREGAWELLPGPTSLQATRLAISQVPPADLRQEQQRVRHHRQRFRLHIRSAKQSNAQLQRLVQRWTALPAPGAP